MTHLERLSVTITWREPICNDRSDVVRFAGLLVYY